MNLLSKGFRGEVELLQLFDWYQEHFLGEKVAGYNDEHRRHFRAYVNNVWGYAVAQLVEALRHKPEGSGFDSRWGHWNFSVT
jgi:hypothetical protein